MTEKYLVICNIAKRNNIRDLCYTAASLQYSILLVHNKNTVDMNFEEYMSVQLFETLESCKEFLTSRHIPLIGIEIGEFAMPLSELPYYPAIAFMPGNEGTGLSKRQKAQCDGFVYIPQYGAGTQSLNVNVATSIVLYSCNNRKEWERCSEDVVI